MKKAKKRLLLSRAQRCHCGRVSSSLDRSITLSPSRHNQASSPKSSCLVAPRIENQIQCATVHENPKRDLDHFVACHNAPTMYSTPIRSFVLSVQLLLALSSIELYAQHKRAYSSFWPYPASAGRPPSPSDKQTSTADAQGRFCLRKVEDELLFNLTKLIRAKNGRQTPPILPNVA